MRVTVKFHIRSQAGVESWQARVSATPPANPRMFRLLLDELVGLFERSGGRPPGTQWVANAAPPRFAVRYTADAWIHFVLKQKEGGRTREVVVIDVTTRSPG